jgi:hypothetical protein
VTCAIGAISGFRALPGRPGPRIRGKPRSGGLAKKLLVEAIFFALNRGIWGSGSGIAGAGLETPAGCHTLGLYGFNQGGGLDFVWQREYGRLRWLDYPVETNKDR